MPYGPEKCPWGGPEQGDDHDVFFLLRGDEKRILCYMVDAEWGDEDWADWKWKMKANHRESTNSEHRLRSEYDAELRDEEWAEWNRKMEAQYDESRKRRFRGEHHVKGSTVSMPRKPLVLKTKEEVDKAKPRR
jgi:hypothetical protein